MIPERIPLPAPVNQANNQKANDNAGRQAREIKYNIPHLAASPFGKQLYIFIGYRGSQTDKERRKEMPYRTRRIHTDSNHQQNAQNRKLGKMGSFSDAVFGQPEWKPHGVKQILQGIEKTRTVGRGLFRIEHGIGKHKSNPSCRRYSEQDLKYPVLSCPHKKFPLMKSGSRPG